MVLIEFAKRIFNAFADVTGRFVSSFDESESIVITVFAIVFIGCVLGAFTHFIRYGGD